jgi:hypothetical protein
MLSDQNVRDVVNKFLEEAAAEGQYEGPMTMEEVLSQAEGESELDPSGFHSMTMFMQVEGQAAVEDYLGMLFETDWTAQEMIDAADGLGEDVEEGSYQGVTTYTTTDATGETTMAADLGGGTFALGMQSAVEDAIDVSTGNGNALSGDLSTYFDQTSGGYMRFASMIPEEQIPEGGSGGTSIPGLQQLRYVSGSFYSESSNLGIDINMHTTDSESATDLSSNLDSILAFAAQDIQDPTAQEIVENIEFEASGQTATMSYVESVSQINTYVETYAAAMFSAGMGGGMSSGSSMSVSPA